MSKQLELAHIWKYYPPGDKYHCEAWVCQTCPIVSYYNPFERPEHIRELEEKLKAWLALKERKKIEKQQRRVKDREQLNKRKQY